MNYIKQINAYWNWVKLNDLPSRAGYLYLALLDCANAAGWKSEFNAPNSTLQAMAGLDKTGLNRYRNLLVQNGLILYTTGKRGTAGCYQIVPLYATQSATNFNDCSAICNQSCYQYETNPATNMKPICVPYLNRNRNKKETETKPSSPPTPSQEVASVFRAWDKASGRCMTRAESEELLTLLDQYGEERLLYAISQGVNNCAVKLSYIRAVLEGRRKNKKSEKNLNSDDEEYMQQLRDIEERAFKPM